jgi:hypothetical protein
MPNLLKKLFCWHDWKTADDSGWMCIEQKCTKCNAEKVIIACLY